MATRGATVLAMIGLVAALVCPAAAAASEFISMPINDGTLSDGFHAQPCHNLVNMVRDAVVQERNRDISVVAGLLRIFFHDCFPNGCDASLLLEDSPMYFSERKMGHNGGLHQGALNLIERIRDTVHRTCKEVSCADITMLATQQAVVLSGGPSFPLQLGKKDSARPADFSDVNKFLPGPGTKIWDLIGTFQSRGFDRTNLVALSGAHTVGTAQCSSLDSRTGADAAFVSEIKRVCQNSHDKRHVLDVTTPNAFDNKYYINLLNWRGVLFTDMELLHDGDTQKLVERFAQDQGLFFEKFSEAMRKISELAVPQASGYRSNCFKPNFIRDTVNLSTEGFAASA